MNSSAFILRRSYGTFFYLWQFSPSGIAPGGCFPRARPQPPNRKPLCSGLDTLDCTFVRPTVKICDQRRHWDVLSVAGGKGIGETTQCTAQGAHQPPAKKRSVFP